MPFNNSLLSKWSAAERSAAEAEHNLITKTSNASGPDSLPCVHDTERAQKLRVEALGLMHQVLAHLKEVADEIAAQNARAFSPVAHIHARYVGDSRQPDQPSGLFQMG